MTRAPVATYRIQLNRECTFRQLEALVPYLEALGVSACYCSPILTARPGSTHGYDISNHAELNPELGSSDEFQALSRARQAAGLGLIVDFVPNHMEINPRTNSWWRDVLENGASSPYARFFDIDWLPVKPELRGKVLLPILNDQYGQVLERGELRLGFRDAALVINYFDHELPINPGQMPMVLGHGIETLVERLGKDHPDVVEFREILTSLINLPSTTETSNEAVAQRQAMKDRAHERLRALVARSSVLGEHIQDAVCFFNGQADDARSFDPLHGLLETQVYRLAYWRTAFDEINYRRFFDVNELASLRMEDPRVFAATHQLLLDLIGGNAISGVRIDHPDGLFNPETYLQSLRAAITERRRDGAVYIVVEKILARGERLRDNWPVDGTTGYNFLNVLNGLFVHSRGLGELRRFYQRFAGLRASAADTSYASKRFIMRTAMASELNVLSRALNRLSEGKRRYRDFTLNSLRRVITEVVACFPIYRTYVTEQGASAEDIVAVDTAIEEALRRNPVEERSIFEFVRSALTPRPSDDTDDPWPERALSFAQKFQQYTAPVMAKGVEDTAFYRDVLLLSANEVGADPRHRARSVAEFHKDNQHRLTRWPGEMTAGSTHDTKRGEDARARINVISELAGEWRAMVNRWLTINESARSWIGDYSAPDRNDEWLFYQTLVGVWPAEPIDGAIATATDHEFVGRLDAYMRKAIREAKRRTSWLHEHDAYERGVATFVKAVLAGDRAATFLSSFVPFQRRLAWFGMLGSLAQQVLRLGAPGVPDLYQGSELWDLSLVDPDNRRPVDFALRKQILAELTPLLEGVQAAPRQLLDNWQDGRIKLYTLAIGLRLRRAHPSLFIEGDYEALSGSRDDPHLVAFSRRHRTEEIVVVVPRFVATLLHGEPRLPIGEEVWRASSIRLPQRLARTRLVNVFTNEIVEPMVHRGAPWLRAADAFRSWPVGMLKVQSSKLKVQS